VYAPHDAEGCADLYKSPGPLKFKHISKFEPFEVGDVKITPVPLVHSKPTLGYCIEHDGARLAYLSDCRELPEATAGFLAEWKPHVICLDCTYPPGTVEPRNHFDLLDALVLAQNHRDSEVSLMHVGHRLDEWLMQNPGSLPEQVTLARDNEIRIVTINK
jgi:phosphoribosyl 1,2-cyclic phosphate phosphodiesterase